jgi:hypothetical protein
MTESFLRFGFARKLTALPPFLHRRQNSANGPTTCGALSFAEVFRQLIEKSSVHRSSIQAGVIVWFSAQSSEEKEEEPLLHLSSLNERDCHTSYDSRGDFGESQQNAQPIRGPRPYGLKSGRTRFPDTHSPGRVKPTAMKRAVRLQGFARQDSGDDRSPICDPENQSLFFRMQLAD